LIRRIVIIALAVAAGWAVRVCLLEGIWIASGSMEPTLPVGTHYFVNRAVYHLHPPERGDIVVFKSPIDAETGLVKRVIAVGGDQIEIRAKQVILNGTPLSEPYAVYKRAQERLVGDNLPAVKVPEHAIFVLGDNRDESEDSSVWKDPKTGERIYFVQGPSIDGRLMKP
jgi:signal peptidase I